MSEDWKRPVGVASPKKGDGARFRTSSAELYLRSGNEPRPLFWPVALRFRGYTLGGKLFRALVHVALGVVDNAYHVVVLLRFLNPVRQVRVGLVFEFLEHRKEGMVHALVERMGEHGVHEGAKA